MNAWLKRIRHARQQRKAYEAMWDAELKRITAFIREVHAATGLKP